MCQILLEVHRKLRLESSSLDRITQEGGVQLELGKAINFRGTQANVSQTPYSFTTGLDKRFSCHSRRIRLVPWSYLVAV